MEEVKNDLIMHNKVFGWIGLVTAFILSIPLVAMQFTQDVDWKAGDFVIVGALLFGMGSLFVLVARQIQRTSSRIIMGVVFLLMVLYLWAELAVGIFTNWGS